MGRTAFYTQAQYDNHTALIRKEDGARVRGILAAQALPAEREEEQRRLEAFRAGERAAADARRAEVEAMNAAIDRREKQDERARLRQSQRRGGREASKRMTATERAAMVQRRTRILELSQPKVYPEATHDSSAYGCVMHQRGHAVVLPEGRNGAPYCPGVDRHRIVPARPDLTHALPPWVGSYSSHHGPYSAAEAAQQAAAESQYYLSASKRPTQERQARAEAVARLEAEHAQRQAMTSTASGETNTSSTTASTDDIVRAAAAAARRDVDNDDVPSVFSHASSHGAIADTGCQHMGLRSTKGEVAQHLSNGGSASLRASRGRTEVVQFEELTLPELSMRIIHMQQRTS